MYKHAENSNKVSWLVNRTVLAIINKKRRERNVYKLKTEKILIILYYKWNFYWNGTKSI